MRRPSPRRDVHKLSPADIPVPGSSLSDRHTGGGYERPAMRRRFVIGPIAAPRRSGQTVRRDAGFALRAARKEMPESIRRCCTAAALRPSWRAISAAESRSLTSRRIVRSSSAVQGMRCFLGAFAIVECFLENELLLEAGLLR